MPIKNGSISFCRIPGKKAGNRSTLCTSECLCSRLSLFAVIFQDLHNCNCLHVLCLMPILHKSLWITDHTMTIIWIIKVIIFLIRSDQQHTMLIGNPRKGLPRLFQLPDWSGLRFTHIDTCPENDRHSFADISSFPIHQLHDNEYFSPFLSAAATFQPLLFLQKSDLKTPR